MDKLNKYKKIYWDIKSSDSKVEESWQKLQRKMNHNRFPAAYFRYGAVVFTLVILLLASTVGLAQAAPPGSALYSVKILSDKIVSKVSGNPEFKVERRAKDLIDISKKQPAQLQEAGKQYNRALDETQKEVEKNEVNQNNFQNSLNKQEESIKEAIKENPGAEKQLNQALENVHKVKEKLNSHSKQNTRSR